MREHAKRILIVDADSVVAQELVGLFSGRGYDVENCKGLTEAIERLKNAKFHCLIMDTQLPEMAGYEAVPIVKALDPALEVIMTTVENSRELELKVRQQNIFYYYIKSFDRKELEQAVNNAFQKIARIKK